MKRLVIAALAVTAVFVVAGSALAAGTKSSLVFDSSAPSGAPTNQVSYGPAAYGFSSIGDRINLAGTARSLSNVTVTLSSWACQQGSWYGMDCVTQPGATFPQQMTLNVYDPSDLNHPIATSTQTLNVPYRPSASSKCTGADAGKWWTPAKECKNGLADDVTFNFSGQKLPATVVYAISYPMSSDASNSLNVAVTGGSPSVGESTDSLLWIDGAANDSYGNYTPAVQFKASNAS